MKRKTIIKQGRRVALAACGLLVGAAMMQSCEDDVLTGQPSWLGNSIYESLQEEGCYTTMLRLIDDLDQTEVLRHTGSKTVFAADDNAFAEWFRTNSWGVRSYEQLSLAQKKLLLNNSMVNNAYLVELMSNVSGNPPSEGLAMRRETAASVYDSVYIMPVDKMPQTVGWEEVRQRGKAIPLLKDNTTAPMIHFLPAFMQYYNITDDDLAMLTNHQATSTSEAWVNGRRIVSRDITCKNGYIHKVDGVIEPTVNMAEILRQHPQMSMWSHLIDRFSAPYYDAQATREYNRLYNNEDSVFTLRYYSRWAKGETANKTRPNGESAVSQIKFDPGWNQYTYTYVADDNDLHYDAAVMIVPTNDALERWWNTEGLDLQEEYKDWDSIPDGTLAKLIDVNMIDRFTKAVPSKFNNLLDDAMETLGITPADVDSCFMGSNGVVYMVNKVFSPAIYASVSYPALAHESTMNIIYWALSACEGDKQDNDQITTKVQNFLPYLLSMQSEYALLLPSNDAMANYIDPSTYGYTSNVTSEDGETYAVEAPNLISFHYNIKENKDERVKGTRYSGTVDANGNFTAERLVQEKLDPNVSNAMLNNLVDKLIIVLEKGTTLGSMVDRGYSLFKTKGGSLLRVSRGDNGNLDFEGGWQMEHNHKKLHATTEYVKTNGCSYLLEEQMPLTSQRSFYMMLHEHPEYQGFLNLLENDYSDLLIEKLNKKYNPGNLRQGNKNFRLFDNYNYTVYVPKNESIDSLQTIGCLPTVEELDMGIDNLCLKEGYYSADTNDAEKGAIQKKVETALQGLITDFVRYHVQDHSVAVGMAPEVGLGTNDFESMKRNPETGRFYPLTANYGINDLSVTDVMGNTRYVVKGDGLYNNIGCEYWFEGTGNSARLFMASDIVVHLINGPLFYEQMKPWREVVREALNK